MTYPLLCTSNAVIKFNQLKLDLYTCSMLTSRRGISENIPVEVNMNVLYIYQSVTLLQNPTDKTSICVLECTR